MSLRRRLFRLLHQQPFGSLFWMLLILLAIGVMILIVDVSIWFLL